MASSTRASAAFAARLALYATTIVAASYFLQDYLLYHPGAATLPGVMDMGRERGLAPWPDAAAYRGWIAEPLQEPTRGTVLVFHGNAGLALQRSHFAEALVRRGLRVLLVEYPAYGARPGTVGESGFVADGAETLALARQQFGEPLYVYGESLGAGVAAAVVARAAAPVAGVAMITPWDTLPDLAQHLYWFLPTRWLVRDRYDSIANLNRWGGPVAVLIAEHDEIIPPEHAQRLFDNLTTPKRRWVFAGSGHNDWPVSADAPWWDEVIAYLDSAARR